MIIDVHAHLNDELLIKNVEDILKECQICNVDKIICSGYDKKSSFMAYDLSNKYKQIYCSLGIHPSSTQDFDDEFINFVKSVSPSPKVVAIGEIGLDYHFPPFDKKKQIKIFVEQLKMAHLLNLPIQIHCRDATGDLIDILKQNKNLLKNGGILHCFSGSFETLNQIKQLGLKISVGGVVTFKNAVNVVELIKKVPLEMITLETDCPYLTPHPFRGKINNPSYIHYTAEKIADLKLIPIKKFYNEVRNNTLQTFPKLKNN